jgi:hypothetical protein
MSQHKRSDVRILNAASGQQYTSRKNAERAVRRGVAQWAFDKAGECLEFLTDGRAAAVRASVVRSIDEAGYDYASSTGRASLAAIAALPVSGKLAGALRLLHNRTKVTRAA